MLLKLIQFDIFHLRCQLVVSLCSIKFPLSAPLSCLCIICCQVGEDKKPEGETCQMSVFDRWDLCV